MSRSVWVIGAAVVLVAGLLLFRGSQKEGNSPIAALQKENKESLDTTEFQSWHEFVSPTGDFSVSFPALPQHAAETLKDPKTKEPRQYDMYVAEKGNGTIFMISVIKLLDSAPAKLQEEMLPSVINDMMSSSPKSRLKTMKMGRYQEYPSIDFSFENEQINVDGKAFISGNTLYLLTSIAKLADYKRNEFDYFINSFKLMNGKKEEK